MVVAAPIQSPAKGAVKSESRNVKRKNKKKKTRAQKEADAQADLEARKALANAVDQLGTADDNSKDAEMEGVEIVYVQGSTELEESDPNFEQFKDVFDHFLKAGEEEEDEAEDEKKEEEEEKENKSDDSSDEGDENKMSKKKARKLKRLSVAELKQLVNKPDVVEVWDTTSLDPRLLVHLKGCRNTVPVPRHWSQKRKYLQGKRGIEKEVWQLPDFIAATGIEKIRQTIQEKEDGKKLKTRTREKTQPKMHKMDIDYQVLHDAFFRFQTKPKLTFHGDLYYEGKEFEVNLKEKRPGFLSEDLKTALGMPVNDHKAPPPWLINMQRYGMPPSYPSLKISGLSAPIPDGAAWGYHPGGWGKPPVNEHGRPIYGDVFGTTGPDVAPEVAAPVEKDMWGELEEEEEEEDDEDEDEDDEEMPDDGTLSEMTQDGQSSVYSGMETPDAVDLRKGAGIETPETPMMELRKTENKLYQVLDTQEQKVGSAAFGSQHTYVVPAADGAEKKKKGAHDLLKKTDDINITLDPAELEGMDQDVLRKKYEEQLETEKNKREREDVSDLMEEHERKRKKKDPKKGDSKAKKFKF